jgi:hypothetical protein
MRHLLTTTIAAPVQLVQVKRKKCLFKYKPIFWAITTKPRAPCKNNTQMPRVAQVIVTPQITIRPAYDREDSLPEASGLTLAMPRHMMITSTKLKRNKQTKDPKYPKKVSHSGKNDTMAGKLMRTLTDYGFSVGIAKHGNLVQESAVRDGVVKID